MLKIPNELAPLVLFFFFINSDRTIKEKVYICQPLGFEDPDHPDKRQDRSNTVYKRQKAYERQVSDEFNRELTFFLGLQVKQKKDRIFISQDKYVAEILKKFRLTDGKSASTPIDTEKPLLKDPGGEDVDVHTYRSMIGSLMYLTSSRPNIMFAVCACARFQVTPKASHLHAVKRIFRYLKGKPHLGLWYPKDSPFDLVAYSDSDHAGASLDRKSITGGCQFLRCRLISWQCKKQTVVATSSTEAEYVATANCYAQVLWIQNQLLDYSPDQMVSGKDSSNPLMADNLPKIVWYSTHHVTQIKSWLVQKQTALGQTTTGKEISNPFMVEKVGIGVSVVDIQVSAVRLMLLLLVHKFLLFGLTNWCCSLSAVSSIKYTLTVNPNIYVSCIKQFWTTIVVKKVNDVIRLQVLVDKKKVVVTKATIREVLCLDDVEGVKCLPNEEIFTELARMGYERPSTKLTFYKAIFSSQWKFLIHTILQCMSAKRTSWNEFSSSMASAVICLSSGRKFNFSKYIFDSLVRNVDSPSKFYMYPHFLQLMIRKQVGDLSTHTTKYTSPALTQKVFENMRRVDEGDDAEVHGEEVNAGDAAEGDVSAAHVDVPTRVETSNETVMDDVSNQGRMIADMDADADVVLEEAKETADDEKYARELEAELNRTIYWDEAINHVNKKAKEDPAVKREDLEALWSLVKEIFSTIKPKNFSDDYLLVTLRSMFESQIYMLKSGKLNELILLVERKYPLIKFTLDQMMNAVRLEVEEESEVSLELLRNSKEKHAKCLMLLVKDLVLPSKDNAVD
uniref:Reverse transcriptase Ty1/copia-type domain-containing protein n=1 Tax=Tanacetum cinerariifolium TaxID=118510 RepID=A0A6L2JR88_TANCI|nr:hypothetical protein [Tanacetum cinerariifolium]